MKSTYCVKYRVVPNEVNVITPIAIRLAPNSSILEDNRITPKVNTCDCKKKGDLEIPKLKINCRRKRETKSFQSPIISPNQRLERANSIIVIALLRGSVTH